MKIVIHLKKVKGMMDHRRSRRKNLRMILRLMTKSSKSTKWLRRWKKTLQVKKNMRVESIVELPEQNTRKKL